MADQRRKRRWSAFLDGKEQEEAKRREETGKRDGFSKKQENKTRDTGKNGKTS